MHDVLYQPVAPGVYRLHRADRVPAGVKTVKRPKDWTKIIVSHGETHERPRHGAVQPDVQYYTPHLGERTPLTGTVAERKAKIRELDTPYFGREAAEKREAENLT